MARIACLWVPGLPLAALTRLEPELHGRPVAIADDRGHQSRLLTVSAEARAFGIGPGMTAAEARAMCGALVVRPHSQDALVAAGNALADVAGSLSARVELDATGMVFLDCAGS